MKTFKDSLLAEFDEDGAVDKSELRIKKDRDFEPSEDASADEVHNILDKAAEDEEVETVTFGLETDDDSIVKVYVAVEDADAFEEALAAAFGEEDNIEDLLDELSREHDIVDVIWPDEVQDDSEDVFADEEAPEEDGEEDGEEDEMSDGSESLNKKHDSFKMESVGIGSRFKEKYLGENDLDLDKSLDNMNPDNDELMSRYGKNKHVALAIEVMKRIGLPATALEFVFKRQPALTREIRDNMLRIGSMNRKRLAQAFEMDISQMSMDGKDEINYDDHDIPTDGDQDVKECDHSDFEHEKMEMKGECDDDKACNCGGTCEDCVKKHKDHHDKGEFHEGEECVGDDCEKVSEWNIQSDINGLKLDYGNDIAIKLNVDEAIDLANRLEKNEKVRLEHNGEIISFTPITGEKDFVVHYSKNGETGKTVLMAEHLEHIMYG